MALHVSESAQPYKDVTHPRGPTTVKGHAGQPSGSPPGKPSLPFQFLRHFRGVVVVGIQRQRLFVALDRQISLDGGLVGVTPRLVWRSIPPGRAWSWSRASCQQGPSPRNLAPTRPCNDRRSPRSAPGTWKPAISSSSGSREIGKRNEHRERNRRKEKTLHAGLAARCSMAGGGARVGAANRADPGGIGCGCATTFEVPRFSVFSSPLLVGRRPRTPERRNRGPTGSGVSPIRR